VEYAVEVLDSLGSVCVRSRSARRVELQLTRSTILAGWTMTGAGSALALVSGLWFLVAGGLLAVLGVVLCTLQRRLVFDRDEGLLRSEQRLLGITHRAAVPLFHLRAVVVERRGDATARPRYVAYVERRNGAPIHLDEARTAAPLLALAEAIAEVAELRLVYDATRG
jgi:hypothetical protein